MKISGVPKRVSASSKALMQKSVYSVIDSRQPSTRQLRTHLADFMAGYNFVRRLNTLSGLTPYEYIVKIWTSEPDRLIVNSI